MDIGADAVVIDVRVALLDHAVEDRIGLVPHPIHLDQHCLDRGGIAGIRRADQLDRQVERAARDRLDRDMDEHEPILVDPAVEILVHRDIVKRDAARFVDAVPIVEDIAGIVHHRREADMVAQAYQWLGERDGQVGRRGRLAPDIGLRQERVTHHRNADLCLRRVGEEPVDVGDRQAGEEMPHTAGGQQFGQRRRGFLDLGEIVGQRDRVDLGLRQIAAVGRQAVMGQIVDRHAFVPAKN